MRAVISVLSAIAILFSSFQVSATNLESKNDTSYYLDIRQVDLPWYLRSHSEYDEGIAVYKCATAPDECALLTEAVTYEELRGLLRRHNITYSVAGIGALIALWWALPIGTGVGIGGVSAVTAMKIIGITFGTGLLSMLPGSFLAFSRMGDKNVEPEETQEDFRLATLFSSEMWIGGVTITTLVFGFEASSLVGPIALGGLAGGIGSLGGGIIVLGMIPGRQTPVGLLPREGPLLRKLLSEKDVLTVKKLSKVESQLVELVDLVVRTRSASF